MDIMRHECVRVHGWTNNDYETMILQPSRFLIPALQMMQCLWIIVHTAVLCFHQQRR